jgi:hypothetical protein
VVFQDPVNPAKFYRTTGYKGQLLHIVVPAGDYAGRAVMFAGLSAEKTLLAVGTLTKVNEVSGTVIGPATRSVTFTLDALKANLTGGTTLTGAGAAYQSSDTVNYNNETIPYFRLYSGFDFDLSYRVTCSAGALVYVHQSYTGACFTSWGIVPDTGGAPRELSPVTAAISPGATLSGLSNTIPLSLTAPAIIPAQLREVLMSVAWREIFSTAADTSAPAIIPAQFREPPLSAAWWEEKPMPTEASATATGWT